MQDIKKSYWDIVKEIKIEDYINPINLHEQKKIFREKIAESSRYNPILEYKELSFNANSITNKLIEIKNNFEKSDDCYRNAYIRRISEDISYISNISSRYKQSETFPSWLTALYGVPTEKMLNIALNILDETPQDVEEEKSLTPDNLKAIFINEIEKYGYIGWNISLENIPAVVSINPSAKTIKIKNDVYFTQSDAYRLIAHEISVHVLRNENGKLQGDDIFRYGFPGYLQTEEGLAITSEEKNGLLSNNDLRRYCSRVVASYFCNKEDFFDLFLRISNYHSFDESFSIVSRIKRGLIDTSVKEGYTKDQVYLIGYLELKKCNAMDFNYLFCGKIGIDDIQMIKNIRNFNGSYTIPSWVNELNK